MILKYKVIENNQTINQILKNKLHISSRLLYKLINKTGNDIADRLAKQSVECNQYWKF